MKLNVDRTLKAQVTAIHLIIGTLQRTHVFGVENRDTLTHKATGGTNTTKLYYSFPFHKYLTKNINFSFFLFFSILLNY